MNYEHRFYVRAPLSDVAAFHQEPASMGAITPPLIRLQIHRAPAALSGGGEMDFTLWFGPLPIRWLAKIENVTMSGFTDRQMNGPFSKWVHHHSFIQVDDDTTEVIDQISIQLKPNLFWRMIGLGFIFGLPVLFAFRAWKTRGLLERGSD